MTFHLIILTFYLIISIFFIIIIYLSYNVSTAQAGILAVVQEGTSL